MPILYMPNEWLFTTTKEVDWESDCFFLIFEHISRFFYKRIKHSQPFPPMRKIIILLQKKGRIVMFTCFQVQLFCFVGPRS